MDLNLKNCKECGRMFRAASRMQRLCERCRESEEKIFLKVREFIYDNPTTNVMEVSNEMDVDEELVLKWLREGRLQLKGEGVGYPCEKCGEQIQTGRFCATCSREISKSLKSEFTPKIEENSIKKKKSKDRMRFGK